MQSRFTRRLGSPLGRRWPLFLPALCVLAPAASAETYYVGPGGTNALSTHASAPGSLMFALAGSGGGSGAAQAGDTIILEDGVYDASPKGFSVYNPKVTLQAQHWHGATISNASDSSLISPSTQDVTGDICQGIVFGPSTGLGWSGGGSANWQFRDCVFIRIGGVGAGNHSLFENCVFSDASSNAFDIGGGEQSPNTGVTFRNCIIRRSNRAAGDDDAVGNKEDFVRDMVFDGLVVYDNNGSALWFDTDCDTWTIKNSTFFGNHGGNNWYYGGIGNGSTTTKIVCSGQDGQGITVGEHMKEITGTPANKDISVLVTAASGSGPQTLTVSPALPAAPVNGDQFIIQQGSTSGGDAVTSEASDNGTLDNNWIFANTGSGFFDHASGGSKFGGTGGLVVTNNLLAYNGESFDYTPDGRDDGPAVVKYNLFKFHPGTDRAFGSGGGSLGGYPGKMGIDFDYNVYDADAASGPWARWYPGNPAVTAASLSDGAQPSDQDYLQDPATWNQDLHSVVTKVPFWGTPPTVSIWPAANDTNWNDIFYPNNNFAVTGSIHQIDDTDGAVDNTIDDAVAGHHAGEIITIPVTAHTPLNGATCKVYDLNGRWLTLTVRPADQAALLATVPPYVACAPGNKTTTCKIRVALDSVAQYDMAATFTQASGNAPAATILRAVSPGNAQCGLVWTPASGATGYNIYRGTTAGSEAQTPVATGVTTTSYTDGTPGNGVYYYTVKAANSYGDSPSSNELSGKAQTVPGQITGNETTVAESQTFDLTALGTIDWRQWGDLAGANDKATGGGQISDLTQFGGATYGRYGGVPCTVGWSDGDLGISNTADGNFLYCNMAQNAGWTFTVPADTTARTLGVFWGAAEGTSVKLNAHLSDGSAPDYTSVKTIHGSDGSEFLLDSLKYNSAKPGQTLTITMTKTDATPGPSIDMMAVWLR